MKNEYITGITTILIAIVGVAAIAVLVSRQAQTSNVVGAASGGFAQDLLCATSPITGSGCGTSVNSIIHWGFGGGGVNPTGGL